MGNNTNQFTYDIKGYQKAKEYLIKVNEWGRVSTSGLSTDGWSVIHEANSIYKRRTNKLIIR